MVASGGAAGGSPGGIFGAWESVLDSLEDRGIHVRSVTDALDERGIPSLGAFALILLLILGAAVFLIYPLAFGAQTGSVRVLVSDASSQSLAGVPVVLASASSTPAFVARTNLTDSDGFALFDAVPAGPVHVSLNSPDYLPADTTDSALSGQVKDLSLIAAPVAAKKVSLHFTIAGPTDGGVVTTQLQDEFFNPLDTQPGLTPSFSLATNTTYEVQVSARGFEPQTLTGLHTGESDSTQTIVLKALSPVQKGNAHIFVFTQNGATRTPVANATVSLLSPSTSAMLVGGLHTADNGRVESSDLEVGTQVKVRVEGNGFAPKVSEVQTISADSSIDVEVRPITSAVVTLAVSVLDGDGNPGQNPLIRLFEQNGTQYSALREETPFDGNSQFTLDTSRKYALSVSQPGNLPQFKKDVTGGSLLIKLVKATPDNSGAVHVHVSSPDGSDASGISVTASATDGTPLGLPTLTTGVDGVQFVDNLPLGSVVLTAEGGGRTGATQVVVRSRNDSASIVLEKAAGTVTATVTDHFSSKPVANALVTITDGAGIVGGNCTTDASGQCSASVLETPAAFATVIAPGFEPFHSASIAVKPNVGGRVSADIIASSVAASTQPEFAGVFDATGARVSSLEPASSYTAHFLLRSPPLTYSSAQLFVYVGGVDTALASTPAQITSFDTDGANRIVGGVDFSLAKAFTPQAGGPNATGLLGTLPTPGSAVGAGVNGAPAYKWASFEYGRFDGTKEAVVHFTTGPTASGKAEFHYRTAYVAGNEIVRSPVDLLAGINESEMLANTLVQSVPINFAGTCSGSTCVQLYIEDDSGRHPIGTLSEPVGTSFKIGFIVRSVNASMTAHLDASGIELGVLGGTSAGNAATVALDPSGKPTATLAVDSASGEGTFSVRAQRVASDASVHFSLSSSSDSAVFDKTFFFRIVSTGTPSVRAIITPSSLVALADSKVTVSVVDSLGLPVTGAHVAVGSVTDAVGNAVQANELGAGSPGVYVAGSVTPAGVGSVDVVVDAAGFALFHSSIPVSATTLVNSKTDKVELSVSSKAQPASAGISLSNLLNNEVTANAVLVKSSQPRLLVLSLSPSSTRIDAKGVGGFTLFARPSDFVMTLAQKTQPLSETVSGVVRMRASIGGSAQVIEVPFTAQLSMTQQDINGVWSVEPSTISIQLEAPSALSQSASIQVSNSAESPLLINQELLGLVGTGVDVQPLSLQLAPGESGTFTVSASAAGDVARDACLFSDSNQTLSLSFIASFQGITSARKNLPISIVKKASGSCAPANVRTVTLPVPLRVEIPSDAKTRTNDDGSTTIQLADGRRVMLASAVNAGGRTLTLPAGAELSVESQALTPSADGTVTLKVPLALTLVFPATVPIVNRPEGALALLENSRVLFPSSLSLASDTASRSVRLSPDTPFSVSPSTAPDLSPDVPVTLPAALTLHFPANSVSRQQADGGQSIELPAGGVVGVGPDAGKGVVNPDGSLTVTLPIGTSLLLPPSSTHALSGGGFSSTLPVAADVEIPSDTQVVTRPDGVVAFLFDFDAVFPAGTSFSASAGGKSAHLVAGSALVFRAVNGNALGADVFAPLPIGLRLILPADVRIEETGVGKTVFLSNGFALGLPPETQLGSPQLDGTRLAQVPGLAQTAWPAGWLVGKQGGGWTLSPGISYAVGFPADAPLYDSAGGKTVQLPDYDMLLPSPGSSFETDAAGKWTKPGGGTTIITPAPDISLASALQVSLPVDAAFAIPTDARIKPTATSSAVRLHDGTVMGFLSPAGYQAKTGQMVVPALSGILLPPQSATVDSKGFSATLPLATTVWFDSTAQVFRKDTLQFVTDSVKATLPLSSRLSQENGRTRVDLSPGSHVAFSAADYSVVAPPRILPLALSLLLPPNAISRTLADGRVYAEFSSGNGLFGLGSTLTGTQLSVPDGTTVQLSGGLSNDAVLPGTAGQNGPDGFSLTFPVPITWTVGSDVQAGLSTKPDGSLVLPLPSSLVIFPRSSRVTRAGNGATAIARVLVPSGARTNLYSASGLPGSVQDAIASAAQGASPTPSPLPLNARALLAAKDNVVVQPPFDWQFMVQPPLTVSGADVAEGIVVIWLSPTQAILLPPTSVVKASSVGGGTTIDVPPSSQVSLPQGMVNSLGDGAWSAGVPLESFVSVPADSQMVQETHSLVAVLSDSQQEVWVPSAFPFSSSAAGTGLAQSHLPSGSKVEVHPAATYSLEGTASVRLPVDAQVSIPPSVRTSTQGSFTLVRFADGSVGQFPAQTIPSSTPTGKIVSWPANLPANIPSTDATVSPDGSAVLTLPMPVSFNVPLDAQIVSGSGTFTAVVNGIMLTAAGASVQPTASGRVVQVPAGARISTQPFGINVIGTPVMLPYEVQLSVPATALVDENTPGGIAIQFPGGLNAKFGSGASFTSASAFSQGGYPSGFGTYNALASALGGQFFVPTAQSTLSPFAGSPTYASQTPNREGTLVVPANTPITLPPGMLIPFDSSQVTSFGSPIAYSVRLPFPYAAITQSDSPPYANPDGTTSVFIGENEVRFPAGTMNQQAAQVAGGIGKSGVGSNQFFVPGLAPTVVTPIYSGRIPGTPVTFPFDVVLQLPAGGRVLPVSRDGTRTVDFGNGARAVFERDLVVDERSVNQPAASGVPEVLIPAGSPVTFTPGIVRGLPPRVVSPLDGAALPQGQSGFVLSLPVASRVRMVGAELIPTGGNLRIYSNPDGTTSAYLKQFEVRLPQGSRALTEPGTSGLVTFPVSPNAPILVVPLQFSAPRDAAISLPVKIDFPLPPAARLLPPSNDGRRVVQFDSNVAIVFEPDAHVVETPPFLVSVDAGSLFTPSTNLISTTQLPTSGPASRSLTFTLPGPAVVTLLQGMSLSANADGTRSLLVGTQEIVFPSSASMGSDSLHLQVPGQSPLIIRPLDASMAQLQSTSLPVALSLSLPPEVKLFPPAPDGTTVAKFADSSGIVFAGANLIQATPAGRVLFLDANTPFSATAGLLHLAPVSPTALRSVRGPAPLLPPALSGRRFLLPVPGIITLAKDQAYSLDSSGRMFIITAGIDEARLSGALSPTKLPDGRVQFALPAGSVIEVRSLDFSTDGLVTVPGLPAPVFLQLPATARVYGGGATAGIADARFIVVDSGRFPGKFVVDSGVRQAAGPTGRFEILADNQGFLAPPNSIAIAPANGYTETLSIPWGLVVPSTAKLSKAADGTTQVHFDGGLLAFIPGNISPIPAMQVLPTTTGFASTGGQATSASLLPNGVTAAGSPSNAATLATNFANRNVFLIPAGVPVRISTAEIDIEKAAGGVPGSVKLTFDIDARTTLPTDAKVVVTGRSALVTYAACTTVQVVGKADNRPYIDSMKVIQMQVDSAAVNPGALVLDFTKGAHVLLRTCPSTPDDMLTYTQYVQSETTFVLPDDTERPIGPLASLSRNGQTCRDLQVFGTPFARPEGVKKLNFPSTIVSSANVADATVHDPRAGTQVGLTRSEQNPKLSQEIPPTGPAKPTVVVAPGRGVAVTVCANALSQGKVAVAGGSAALQLFSAEPPAITYTFTDGALSLDGADHDVCLRNNGATNIVVAKNDIHAAAPADKYLSIPKALWKGVYAENADAVTLNPKEDCVSVRIPAAVPPDSEFLDPLNPGCLAKEGSLGPSALVFNGKTDEGTVRSATVQVNIVFKRNPGKCDAIRSRESALRLNGFYATYAFSLEGGGTSARSAISQEIDFKAPGHTRFFALVNNRKEAVTLATAWPRADDVPIVDCKLASGSALDKHVMQPGTSELVSCVSQTVPAPGLTRQWKIMATPASPGSDPSLITQAVMQFTVYNPPDSLKKSLYSSSPWGELAAADAQNAFDGAASPVSNTPPSAPPSPPSSSTTTTSTSTTTTVLPGTPSLPSNAPSGLASATGPAPLSAISLEGATPSAVSSGGAPFTGSPAPGPSLVIPGDGFFTLCEEKYCSETQAAEALASQVLMVKQSVDAVILQPNADLVKTVNALRASLPGNRLTKTFIIQKAGFRKVDGIVLERSINQFLSANSQAGSPNFVMQGNDLSTGGSCGIYLAQTSVLLKEPNFGGGQMGAQNYLSGLDYESSVRLLSPCDESVANTALLLGADSQQVGVTVGRRVVSFPSEWGHGISSIVDGFHQGLKSGFASLLGAFSLGPYGPEPDEKDVTTASSLYDTFYPGSPQHFATAAQSYGDASATGFCNSNAGAQLGAVTATAAQVFGISALLTIPSAGFSSAVTVAAGKFLAGGAQAGLFCSAQAAGIGAVSRAGGKQGVCEIWNSCIYSTIFSFSAARGRTAATTNAAGEAVPAASALTNTVGGWKGALSTTLFAGILSAGFAYISPETESATIPLVQRGIPPASKVLPGALQSVGAGIKNLVTKVKPESAAGRISFSAHDASSKLSEKTVPSLARVSLADATPPGAGPTGPGGAQETHGAKAEVVAASQLEQDQQALSKQIVGRVKPGLGDWTAARAQLVSARGSSFAVDTLDGDARAFTDVFGFGPLSPQGIALRTSPAQGQARIDFDRASGIATKLRYGDELTDAESAFVGEFPGTFDDLVAKGQAFIRFEDDYEYLSSVRPGFLGSLGIGAKPVDVYLTKTAQLGGDVEKIKEATASPTLENIRSLGMPAKSPYQVDTLVSRFDYLTQSGITAAEKEAAAADAAAKALEDANIEVNRVGGDIGTLRNDAYQALTERPGMQGRVSAPAELDGVIAATKIVEDLPADAGAGEQLAAIESALKSPGVEQAIGSPQFTALGNSARALRAEFDAATKHVALLGAGGQLTQELESKKAGFPRRTLPFTQASSQKNAVNDMLERLQSAQAVGPAEYAAQVELELDPARLKGAGFAESDISDLRTAGSLVPPAAAATAPPVVTPGPTQPAGQPEAPPAAKVASAASKQAVDDANAKIAGIGTDTAKLRQDMFDKITKGTGKLSKEEQAALDQLIAPLKNAAGETPDAARDLGAIAAVLKDENGLIQKKLNNGNLIDETIKAKDLDAQLKAGQKALKDATHRVNVETLGEAKAATVLEQETLKPIAPYLDALGEFSSGVKPLSSVSRPQMKALLGAYREALTPYMSNPDITAATKNKIADLVKTIGKAENKINEGTAATLEGKELGLIKNIVKKGDALTGAAEKGAIAGTLESAAARAAKVKVATGRVLRSFTGAYARGLISTLLFNVDVRPVRAMLSPGGKVNNHLVVYHLEDRRLAYILFFAGPTSRVPTVYSACTQDLQAAPGTTACASGTEYLLANACNSDFGACILVKRNQFDSPELGFTVLVALNNPALQSQQAQLFASLFSPNAAPLVALPGGVQAQARVASSSDVSAFANEPNELGSGKGLNGISAGASPENAAGGTATQPSVERTGVPQIPLTSVK